MIYLYITLVCAITLIYDYIHYRIIVVNKILIPSDEKKYWFIARASTIFFLSIPFIDQSQTYLIALISLGKYMLLGGAIFWLIFDAVLNWSRKLPFLYLGLNAASDNLFKKNELLYFIIKLVVLGISILTFVL